VPTAAVDRQPSEPTHFAVALKYANRRRCAAKVVREGREISSPTRIRRKTGARKTQKRAAARKPPGRLPRGAVSKNVDIDSGFHGRRVWFIWRRRFCAGAGWLYQLRKFKKRRRYEGRTNPEGVATFEVPELRRKGSVPRKHESRSGSRRRRLAKEPPEMEPMKRKAQHERRAPDFFSKRPESTGIAGICGPRRPVLLFNRGHFRVVLFSRGRSAGFLSCFGFRDAAFVEFWEEPSEVVSGSFPASYPPSFHLELAAT